MVIPKNVQSIQDRAFEECTNLKSIVIPESVLEIGADLFKDGNSELTIFGRKGSAAERWAADNGFAFAEK